MLETINNWLPVVSALVAGLLFIWRTTHNLNKTLLSLTNGVNTLNEHLNDVDNTATRTVKHVNDHEIRIVIIERELGISQGSRHRKEEKDIEN